MSTRALTTVALLAAAMALAACGEKPQANGSWTAAKRDAAPNTGGSPASFTQEGWKAGDANSWSQQLKARTQYGQNDHQRVVTP